VIAGQMFGFDQIGPPTVKTESGIENESERRLTTSDGDEYVGATYPIPTPATERIEIPQSEHSRSPSLNNAPVHVAQPSSPPADGCPSLTLQRCQSSLSIPVAIKLACPYQISWIHHAYPSSERVLQLQKEAALYAGALAPLAGKGGRSFLRHVQSHDDD